MTVPRLSPFGRSQTGRNPCVAPDLIGVRFFSACLRNEHAVLPTVAGVDCNARSAPAFVLSLHGTIAA